VTTGAREAILSVIAAALLAAAVTVDLGSGEAQEPVVSSPEVSFVGRASFCAPLLDHAGANGSVTASFGLERARIDVLPEPDDRVRAETRVWSGRLRRRPQEIEGRGAPVYAGMAATLSGGRKQGAAATRCAGAASPRWYFPAGSTAIGHDERITLYNPFPEEAVVSLTLYTPASDIVKSALSDVAVPAGATRTVRLDRVVVPRPVLGAEVAAVRGRLVAWKSVVSRPREGARGVSLSLGATELATRWFFAYGFGGPQVHESVSILNPSNRELTVTVSLAGKDRAAQPAELIDVSVAPRSARRLIMREGPPGGSPDAMVGMSATVTSTNGVDFVAEREVAYGRDRGDGTTSELGATSAARAWLLTPPVAKPDRDALAILNPTARDGRVDVLLRGDDQVRRPQSLQGLEIGAGLRLEIPLQRWTSGVDPIVAVVTADVAVVAERYAKADRLHDRADVAGLPLPAS
jgi:hypothetical protein